VPVPDDDDRYFKTSYGSRSAHQSGGGTRRTGDNDGDNVTKVTYVTEENAKTAALGDPLTREGLMRA
jgi:hypothetical protein